MWQWLGKWLERRSQTWRLSQLDSWGQFGGAGPSAAGITVTPENALTVPAVYRLSKPGAPLGRVEGRTLDLLCTALGVQPGELLTHEPEKRRR